MRYLSSFSWHVAALTVVMMMAMPTMARALEQHNDETASFSLSHSGTGPAQQACVTLLKYKDRSCSGTPSSLPNSTVPTAKGSPCKHTAKMGSNSIKDQYCTFSDHNGKEATLHQTVYIKSKSCKVPWYEKAISPMTLTYTTTKCTYGYKLGSCVPGPCNSSTTANNHQLEFLRGSGEDHELVFELDLIDWTTNE